MNQELEDSLRVNYPYFFEKLDFIECRDGWFEIISDLCRDLDNIISEQQDKDYYFEQIKQKFGGLRVYMNRENDAIRDTLQKAEDRSYKTCEVCGIPGKTVSVRGWLFTLCEDHHNKYQENNN
jgi:hypothetical protein